MARSVNYQLLNEVKRKVQLGIYGCQRLNIVKSKAPANISNFVGCNMLRAFGHPVAKCCDMFLCC